MTTNIRFDERLERLILGTWISDERFRQAWKPEPDLFAVRGHQLIAEVFADAFPAKRWSELFTVAELEKRGKLAAIEGGREGVFEILGGPMLPHPLAELDKLRELRALRNLRCGAREIEGAIDAGERLAKVQERMRAAVEASIAGVGLPLVSGRELMAGLAEDLKRKTPITYCTTGWADIDARTRGLRPGWVALFGADTSFGKTAHVAQLVDCNLRFGKRVLVVSTEDELDAYRDRLLARRTAISFSNVIDRRLEAWQFERLLRAAGELEQAGQLFLLRGEGVPVETLAGQIRAACAAHKINLVAFDYAQAAVTEKDFAGSERPREVSYIGRTVTSAIKQSRAAGVLYTQLTMPPNGQTPTKESVRDSKDLIKAAEIVLIGYERDGDRHVAIEKAKFGRKGLRLQVPWDARTANFIDDIGSQLVLEQDEEAA